MTTKRLISTLLVLMLIFSCFSGMVSANTPELYADAAEHAAVIAEMLLAAGAATSFQYALIHNGDIVVSEKAGAFSLVENRVLTTDDLYGAGSLSKMYTAAAAMKLVEDGKLDLDRPIVQYITDFKMADPRHVSITARMLLNHSSGLSGSTMSNAFLLGDNDQDATLSLMGKLEGQSLRFDPGAFSVYCNDGFTLAQILVERISGQDFTRFLRESFFVPLGMDRTKTSADDFDINDIVDAYPYGIITPRELVNVIGTGGIYTTAEDLCRFSLALTGESVLGKASADEMMAREYLRGIWPKDVSDNTIGFGLGWDSVDFYPYNHYGVQALSKGGDTPAYHAVLIALPEYGLAAAVLSSGGSSSNNTIIANALLEGTLLAMGEIDTFFPGKSFETERQVMPADLKGYAGFYGSFLQVVKAEITDDGRLIMTSPEIPSAPAEQFFYTGSGTFTNQTGEVRLSFVEEGELTYIRMDIYVNVPALGAVTAASLYHLQRLESNTLDSATAAAWSEREGQLYLIVNERFSSIAYMGLPAIGVGLMPDLHGYIASMRIVDADNAKSFIQIPGVAGRDLRDIEFIREDGVEYALYSDYKAISISDIPYIHSGPRSICTIQPDGQTRWYKMDASLAGKTISVDVPENAAFFVYEATTGMAVMNSHAFGTNEAVLPESAFIGFAGEVGARFVITIR